LTIWSNANPSLRRKCCYSDS